MGTSTCQRLPVSFTAAQRRAIAERAAVSGQSLSATVRELVAAALEQATENSQGGTELIALATLAASEHTLRLLEQFVPQGERRSAELRQAALIAAEARLEELRRQLEDKA